MRKLFNWPILILSWAIATYMQFLFWEVLVSCYLFLLAGRSLILSLGKEVPVRSLITFLLALQMLLAPLIAYFGNDSFVIDVYRMQVSPETYFAYAIPSFIAFGLGLRAFYPAYDQEPWNKDFRKISLIGVDNKAYTFIIVGLVASLLLDFVPSGLAFYIYLIACLKFVGLFILVIFKNKLPIWMIILVFGLIISSSLNTGMFHDLLIWVLFLASFVFIRYKPSLTLKVSVLGVFAVFAIGLQLVKSDYRSGKYGWGSEGIISTIETIEATEGEVFSIDRLRQNAVRFNQGYILSHVLSTVPKEVPHTKGSTLMEILLSAIFPRFLYPDKLRAGDQEFFMNYSGMQLNATTSMGLGAMADMYINFGVVGGAVAMGLLGLFFHFLLIKIYLHGQNSFLLMFFIPLIFMYTIRPDCETQTSLGHLFKSLILAFIMYKYRFLSITNYAIQKSIN